MKKKYIYIGIVLFLFNVLSVQSQDLQAKDEYNDFQVFQGKVTSDLSTCCGIETMEDITFSYSLSSALYAQQLIISAFEDRLNAWRDRQEGILKNEIEKQLGQTFPNFLEARNTYFKKLEWDNVLRNIGGLKSTYSTKRAEGFRKQEKYLRSLKLLKLRENEIISGHIYNSSYTNLNYNGTPISEITDINQLRTHWGHQVNLFSNNYLNTHNDKYTYEKLVQMGNINDYNHYLLNALLNSQLQNYNKYNLWEKLNLMQIYIKPFKVVYTSGNDNPCRTTILCNTRLS